MTKQQQRTLIYTAAVMIVMFIFPPFHTVSGGYEHSHGYGFVLSGEGAVTINALMLLVQEFTVFALGWIVFKLQETSACE